MVKKESAKITPKRISDLEKEAKSWENVARNIMHYSNSVANRNKKVQRGELEPHYGRITFRDPEEDLLSSTFYKKSIIGQKDYLRFQNAINRSIKLYREAGNKGKEESLIRLFNYIVRKQYKDAGEDPAKYQHAYTFRAEELRKERLENRTLGTTAILGVLGSIFFLSSNVTGNAISNLSQMSSNWIGAGLFLVAVVLGVIWLKRKKNKIVIAPTSSAKKNSKKVSKKKKASKK